jgi:hypothetical protein
MRLWPSLWRLLFSSFSHFGVSPLDAQKVGNDCAPRAWTKQRVMNRSSLVARRSGLPENDLTLSIDGLRQWSRRFDSSSSNHAFVPSSLGLAGELHGRGLMLEKFYGPPEELFGRGFIGYAVDKWRERAEAAVELLLFPPPALRVRQRWPW